MRTGWKPASSDIDRFDQWALRLESATPNGRLNVWGGSLVLVRTRCVFYETSWLVCWLGIALIKIVKAVVWSRVIRRVLAQQLKILLAWCQFCWPWLDGVKLNLRAPWTTFVANLSQVLNKLVVFEVSGRLVSSMHSFLGQLFLLDLCNQVLVALNQAKLVKVNIFGLTFTRVARALIQNMPRLRFFQDFLDSVWDTFLLFLLCKVVVLLRGLNELIVGGIVLVHWIWEHGVLATVVVLVQITLKAAVYIVDLMLI